VAEMSQGYGAPVPGCNQQQLIVWWLNAGERCLLICERSLHG
jgi:hypothetical protein